MDTPDQSSAATESRTAPAPMPPTLWTVVLAAGAGSDAALEQLCRACWRPIHTYLRRWGYSEADAQDLTQDFLTHLLEKDRLARVRRDKGRFRSYLLAALRHFVIDKDVRQRRLQTLPLESEDPHNDHGREPADPSRTPDEEFERSFTLTLIQNALDRLREDYVQHGQAERFAVLRQFLPGEDPQCSQAEVGLRLGLAEGAVAKAVHDLRRRFAECFRELVGQTVGAFEEVNDEVKHHLAVMSR